eukprot:6481789-Amphidinium_carterae.1
MPQATLSPARYRLTSGSLALGSGKKNTKSKLPEGQANQLTLLISSDCGFWVLTVRAFHNQGVGPMQQRNVDATPSALEAIDA